ncbi:hypothetical protein Csa_019238 [Cucumis sativus]|uniref:VQ domain-containing protein n=1 Tax=Cucumis sativus TaxID=3659 RepID=A0A0A0LIA7_CUCSA|nr:hypothetical protein Csa_019238 [Cucumis sativus]
MGKCGENQYTNHNHSQSQSQNQNPTKVQRKPIKVKYISSPMMIKASNALEFRAIVQQLTGFDSNTPTRRRNQKLLSDCARTPSAMFHADRHEMEVLKFSDDHHMESLLQFDGQGCFETQNNNNILPNNIMEFQSSCFFQ